MTRSSRDTPPIRCVKCGCPISSHDRTQRYAWHCTTPGCDCMGFDDGIQTHGEEDAETIAERIMYDVYRLLRKLRLR